MNGAPASPAGRLAVTQRVLGLDRVTQFGEALVNLAVAIKNFARQHRSDDGENRPPGVGAGGFLGRHERRCGQIGLLFNLGRGNITFGRKRDAACRKAHCSRQRHEVGVIGRSKDVVPAAKPHKHFIGQADETLGYGRVFLHEVQGDTLHHHANVLNGQFALPSHHRGVGEHVLVMRRINDDQALRWPEDRAVVIVRGDGLDVPFDGFVPAAAADINVGGHVDAVPKGGLQFAQAIRGGVCELGTWRGLDGMDVEMIRQWMVDVDFQHGIKRRENLLSTRLWMAIGSPLIPRPQVHHRFGKKRADIGIFGVGFPDQAHRVGVSAIERTAILGLWIGIPMAKRLDECVLYHRSVCHVFLGKGEFLRREFGCWRRHVRKVDVRPARERDTPMRHGAGGISLLRRLERANRCAVVEAEQEVEALVEVFLRFGRVRRNLSRVRPQAFEEGFQCALGADTGNHQRENETADRAGCFHGLR